ncbi:MAG TPA: AAA family ATPase [Actinophytocola sp.]|jgi:predicted kinase|nr:AAA family ATPase [Actinophytocola sp.]
MKPVSIDALGDGGSEEPRWHRPTLVVVGGLPATGKTTVSRAAAGKAGAACLRIDTIEQAVTRFAARENSAEALRHAVSWGLGYDVAYAVAKDLLRQGSHVFAECVNPMKITRDAWRDVAETTGAHLVEVELVCSDPAEHERRATTRSVDIPDLVLPTWADILEREYEPWDRPHVVLDTAGKPAEDTIAALCEALGIIG